MTRRRAAGLARDRARGGGLARQQHLEPGDRTRGLGQDRRRADGAVGDVGRRDGLVARGPRRGDRRGVDAAAAVADGADGHVTRCREGHRLAGETVAEAVGHGDGGGEVETPSATMVRGVSDEADVERRSGVDGDGAARAGDGASAVSVAVMVRLPAVLSTTAKMSDPWFGGRSVSAGSTAAPSVLVNVMVPA